MQKRYIIRDKCILLFTLLIFSIGTYSLFGNTRGVNFFDLAVYQHRIKGVVTDSGGTPVQGASVRLKGTPTGTFTNNEGVFYLEATPTDVLIITYIGYKSLEIRVGSKEDFSIVLEDAITDLGAVTVNAGYYTVLEKERTGSISGITAADIEKQPISNPLAAMQGKIPGVYISQNSGVPGGDFSIQIRGRNSIRLDGNDPLFIVDGVPYPSDPITSSLVQGANGNSSPLNSINPSDIADIEVLKDADATSIYGSRGANGVVLITTKKGKSGKLKLDVNLQSGIGQVSNFMNVLNTDEYITMREEAFANDNREQTSSNAYDLLEWDRARYTDWQEELIGGSSYINNIYANLSGGSDQTTFRFGGGYRDESVVFPGDFGNQRITGQLNLNHYSSDQKFHANITTSYTHENNDLLASDPTLEALTLPPNAPSLYNDNGELNWADNTWDNPMADFYQTYTSKIETFNANAHLSYEFIKGLKGILNAGYNTMNIYEVQTTPQSSYNPNTLGNRRASTVNTGGRSIWILEPQLAYEKSWGEHRLQAMVGGTFQKSVDRTLVVRGTGYTSDLMLENLQGASEVQVRRSQENIYEYKAGFIRLNYNYNQRYIINLTGRRDGSSRFGPGKAFANFGAVGLAWLFSNEDFINKGLPFLSFGKLRGSYGTTGSDQIGDYQFMDLWQTSIYPYQGISGLTPIRAKNADFGWETNRKLEFAIELGFFNDRIFLTTNYFRNRTGNQLVGLPLPGITGFNSVQANLPATIENTGWEFQLQTDNIRGVNFNWHTNFNISVLRNNLLEYPNLDQSPYARSYTIGHSLLDTKNYEFSGVNPDTGVYEVKDQNDDGRITTTDDLISTGDIGIDFFGGLDNSFEYKQWDLSFFFQFVKQRQYNSMLAFSTPGFISNQPIEVLERWQSPGDVTDVQKFTSTYGDAYFAYFDAITSNYTREDTSFIRLRNISLSYSLPKNTLPGMDMRLYVLGQNLFTITGYSGLNPEFSSSTSLPTLRQYMLGVQLTF